MSAQHNPRPRGDHAARSWPGEGPRADHTTPQGAAPEEPEPRGQEPASQADAVAVPSRKLPALALAALLVLGLDIATKALVVAHLEGHPAVRILGGAVYLDVVRNSGAAFSLATGITWVLALVA
ncbi:MAG: signal peptidase II, partial [Sciscionella sp.]